MRNLFACSLFLACSFFVDHPPKSQLRFGRAVKSTLFVSVLHLREQPFDGALARRALSRFENFRQAIQKLTIHDGSIGSKFTARV
jgi:hypothetical protein